MFEKALEQIEKSLEVQYRKGYEKAIDDFMEAITVKSEEASFKAVIDGGLAIDVVALDYVLDVAMEIAEEMRCKE